MSVSLSNDAITWEKLPDDFVLDDEPVENIDQPLLAAALRESLELAGLLREEMLVASNFGLCATVNGKIVVKAPDWVYVRSVAPLLPQEVRRSYTPHLEWSFCQQKATNTQSSQRILQVSGFFMSKC